MPTVTDLNVAYLDPISTAWRRWRHWQIGATGQVTDPCADSAGAPAGFRRDCRPDQGRANELDISNVRCPLLSAELYCADCLRALVLKRCQLPLSSYLRLSNYRTII